MSSAALRDTPTEVTPLRPPPPKDYKKIVLYSGIGLAVFIATLLSYFWFVYATTHITTDNAYVDADLYSINCRIMGYVKEVLVKDNEPVKKGQVLAVLDDTDFGVELGYKKAKFTKAKNDFDRAKKLFGLKAISSSDFELAQANFVANEADYNGTLLKIKYTQVTSPTDGVVAKKTVQMGQFVQPGQSLFVVVPTNQKWIKANYKETQLAKVQRGQKVIVRADAYPGRVFHGHVESVFPTSGAKLSLLPPENASGNFTKVVQRIPIKIELDSKNTSMLKIGMSVTSTIIIDDEPESESDSN